MNRVQICLETSPSFRYWKHYLESKGFKTEIVNGMLYRLMDEREWGEYLAAIAH